MNPYLNDLMAFADLLAACNVIHEEAVHDSEDYDGGVTMHYVAKAHQRLKDEEPKPLSQRLDPIMLKEIIRVSKGRYGKEDIDHLAESLLEKKRQLNTERDMSDKLAKALLQAIAYNEGNSRKHAEVIHEMKTAWNIWECARR